MKKDDYIKAEVYLVDWIDSVNNSGWLTSDECKADLLVCQTVGFLVEENKESLCLALNRTTRSGYRPFGDLISIPKCSIKKRVRLKGDK